MSDAIVSYEAKLRVLIHRYMQELRLEKKAGSSQASIEKIFVTAEILALDEVLKIYISESQGLLSWFNVRHHAEDAINIRHIIAEFVKPAVVRKINYPEHEATKNQIEEYVERYFCRPDINPNGDFSSIFRALHKIAAWDICFLIKTEPRVTIK